MFRVALLLAALVTLSTCLSADEKPLTEEQRKRVEELKKQIGEKKAEVAKLEVELSKLEPVLQREQARIPAASRKVMIDAHPARPNLKSFEKGQIGYLDTDQATTVHKVIDERQAVLTFRSVAGKNIVKINVLVSGIDTSNLFDGKEWELRAVVYMAGNAKADGQTLQHLIVFEFLPGEVTVPKKDK